MTVFSRYASYYDLFYSDKPYESEVAFVERLLKKHASGAGSLLELGCGTGGFSELLAGSGYLIHGVDASVEMLSMAEHRKNKLPLAIATQLTYSQGDIRTFSIDRKFDAAIAMFHVLGYVNNNNELIQALQTVHRQLTPEGLFVFDFWYGPAVLIQQPSVREKFAEDAFVSALRIANPMMKYNENVVDINYSINIKDKLDGTVQNITEIHSMRYFFVPELMLMLDIAGFDVIDVVKWLSDEKPDPDSWSACIVARKKCA